MEARKHRCIIVLPNCPNSFYTNNESGFNYYDYVVKELPKKICSYFPASDKREDTFIMGASMGGYGSYLIVMNNPDKYAAAYSFSGPLGLDYENGKVFGFSKTMSRQGDNAFGGYEKFHSVPYYLPALAEKLDRYEGEKPRLKMICGTEDIVCLTYSNRFAEEVRKNTSLSFEYVTDKGEHEFDFWNRYLPAKENKTLSR